MSASVNARWRGLATLALGLAAAPSAPAQDHPHGTRRGATRSGAVAREAASGVRLGSVVLTTGVRLEYAEVGPRDGEPVLFLHGITDSWFSYGRVLERLPTGIRALVPSQRGHGDSDRPACCYRMDDFAADAVAFLDALGIERATVVGHSMGSIIAQRVATTYRDRVAKVVLIGSGTRGKVDALLDLQKTVVGLTDPVSHEFIVEFQYSTVQRPVPETFMQRVVAETGKVPARVWRDALAALLASETAALLPRIQAPTLIVWGEEDGIFGWDEQDKLLQLITGARLEAYAATGHAPHWEQPERLVADLERFLGEGRSRGPAEARVPLYHNLGSLRHEISTSVPPAQRYCDQGLRLTYALNHAEVVPVRDDAQCGIRDAQAIPPVTQHPRDVPLADAPPAAYTWRARSSSGSPPDGLAASLDNGLIPLHYLAPVRPTRSLRRVAIRARRLPCGHLRPSSSPSFCSPAPGRSTNRDSIARSTRRHRPRRATTASRCTSYRASS